ncbi:MAG TPA: hypothetical protein VIB39_01075 [Candidatus Angelobacter sp.]
MTTRDIELGAQILTWMQESLVAPTPQVKRSRKSQGEPVCPFLSASIESGHCHISLCDDMNDAGTEALAEFLLSWRDKFKSMPPSTGSAAVQKSLVIAFPGAGKEFGKRLDEVHGRIKSDFVRGGLMIGRFHPWCDSGSVWNQNFKAFTSPFPLVAIRYMAIHDIYFVRENAAWFREYENRFGRLLQDARKIPPYQRPILVMYRLVKDRFARRAVKGSTANSERVKQNQ